MRLGTAIEKLVENYNYAVGKEWVQDKVAWALYHTWKEADEHRAEQTEPMKTTDYCDICKRDMCEDCIADATNPYCVPSHYEINYEPKDEPQMGDAKPIPLSNRVTHIKDEP